MDVRIGVTQAREMELELADDTDAAKLTADIESALADGKVLWLTDKKGRRVGVPAEKVAYIEIGQSEERKVGFSGA